MIQYLYELYYRIKSYFRPNNNAFDFTNENRERNNKITTLDLEIKDLYNLIDEKYLYNTLKTINPKLNENTNINDILAFLEEEKRYIVNNKDNLEINLNEIKQNMYIIELLSKFTILEEIKQKEIELNKLYI